MELNYQSVAIKTIGFNFLIIPAHTALSSATPSVNTPLHLPLITIRIPPFIICICSLIAGHSINSFIC